MHMLIMLIAISMNFVHFSDVARTESADAIVGMVSHPLALSFFLCPHHLWWKTWDRKIDFQAHFSAAILVLTGIQRFDFWG